MNHPILPLMWCVRRPGGRTRPPGPGFVYYDALTDRAWFAPRWIAWLYRILPVAVWWTSPGRDFVGPGIAGYGWYIGYVRECSDGGRPGWIAFLRGRVFGSPW